MSKYFIQNQACKYDFDEYKIDKLRVSFIGDVRILERSGYGLEGKDFIFSDKYQVTIFSVEDVNGFEKADIVLIAASGSLAKDSTLLQNCRKFAKGPIIVLGKDDETYSANMLYAGADDYLKLPCSKRVLDTLIYIHVRRELR